MATTGIKETEDVLAFVKVLSVKILSNPVLLNAIKSKDWGAAGAQGAALFIDKDVQTTAIEAVNGIQSVLDEIKDLSVLEGLTLGTDALDIARACYEANKSNV